jgi:hypothetical protein
VTSVSWDRADSTKSATSASGSSARVAITTEHGSMPSIGTAAMSSRRVKRRSPAG